MSLRSVIKSWFQTGDVPTQTQYSDTFDSTVIWDDDVEHTLTNDANKVPASDAVFDAIADVSGAFAYTKDADGNVFYNGVTATLGANSARNIFQAGNSLNILGDDCFDNIFNQNVSAIELGNVSAVNIFEQGISSFIFRGGFQRCTVKSGAIGADYTASPDYDFMYSLPYPSQIFRNPENDANYHSYYDPTNDRIVLTNLTTLAISYIGGSGGSGDVVGPASSVDSQIALFDGTTGKLIKDSGVLLSAKVNANTAITGATKTKVTYDSKGLVTSGADATTADIADSTDKRYVTDALLTKLGAIVDTFTTIATIGSWAAPADSTTYYVPTTGGVATPLTTITTFLNTYTSAIKIVGVVVQHYNATGTVGTSENVAIGIRNNTDATNHAMINIQTNQASTVTKNFEDMALNIDIPANKTIGLYITTPAWATNPTNVVLRITLYIQKG
jgi:hypothetical protein